MLTLPYVVDLHKITARVVVTQTDVDLVRHSTLAIEAKLPERIAETLPAVMKREVPAATDELPSIIALGSEGGGKLPVDPRDSQAVKVFQTLFMFDVELPNEVPIINVGGRVYVRFDHGRAPLAWQWYRGLRQLFLKHFNV